jgi:hypothetical protein
MVVPGGGRSGFVAMSTVSAARCPSSIQTGHRRFFFGATRRNRKAAKIALRGFQTSVDNGCRSNDDEIGQDSGQAALLFCARFHPA